MTTDPGYGPTISDPSEGLIRRGRRNRQQGYYKDQQTNRWRLPVTVFEPRMPENHPNATHFDKYLSVNLASSLTSSGQSLAWGYDQQKFYAAMLLNKCCIDLCLPVTAEPIKDEPGIPDNPHHAAIHGLIELFHTDRDRYDIALTLLSRAAEMLPESLKDSEKASA